MPSDTLQRTINKLDEAKADLLRHIEQEEIDGGSGEFRCAYLKCKKPVEVMEPYIIVVVNNTEDPEQTTYRFDSAQCFLSWDLGSGIIWAGMKK